MEFIDDIVIGIPGLDSEELSSELDSAMQVLGQRFLDWVAETSTAPSIVPSELLPKLGVSLEEVINHVNGTKRSKKRNKVDHQETVVVSPPKPFDSGHEYLPGELYIHPNGNVCRHTGNVKNVA